MEQLNVWIYERSKSYIFNTNLRFVGLVSINGGVSFFNTWCLIREIFHLNNTETFILDPENILVGTLTDVKANKNNLHIKCNMYGLTCYIYSFNNYGVPLLSVNDNDNKHVLVVKE